MAYCLILVNCFLVIASTCSSQIISFDIVRTKSQFQEMLEQDIHPKELERALLDIKNDSVPLFRYLDSEFYGEVLIGHPGQKFNVIFDTAWANSWVPSSMCKVTSIACHNHNQYNSHKSSTYKADGRSINIPYGTSTLSGILSTDLFHLGKSNITSQTFAEMMDIPLSFFTNKADGVLGLAFPSVSFLGVTPVLDNMIEKNVISKKVFSFYFNRDKASSKGGTLFLGGSQKKHYLGNFTYVDLIATDYWRFYISSIHVKGNSSDVCNNVNCPAIIDTSSTIISGPTQAIAFLNQKIGARQFLFGKYMVSCGSIGALPSVTFNIGGRNFILKSRDYVRKMTISLVTVCVTVFEASDLPDTFKNYWTLGASFMSRFYVEFDAENKRVGFADIRM